MRVLASYKDPAVYFSLTYNNFLLFFKIGLMLPNAPADTPN